MTSCTCCNRGLNPEWAEKHKFCGECLAKGCTAHRKECAIPEVNILGGRGDPREVQADFETETDEGLSESV